MIDLQTANPIAGFLTGSDKVFQADDLAIIEADGLAGWVVQQEELIWEDETLEWDVLPVLLRALIITETIEALEMPVRYAVPFRHLGRVITFAVLPAKIRPLQVRLRPRPGVEEGRRPLLASGQTQQQIDPPVPFLTMGLASPMLMAIHARTVRKFLRSAEGAGSFYQNLRQIMIGLAKEEKITKSEAFYYLLSMRALASRSWQQLREYFGLMTLEYVVEQAVSQHPGQAQMLAYAHLVEGARLEVKEPELLA